MATSMVTDLVSTEQSQTAAQHAKRESERGSWIIRLSELYARVALGAGFLVSVADRFGLWGAYGRPNVSWGNFQNFVQYTGMVNSFLPTRMILPLAWAATIAETVFGVGLLLGLYQRVMAIGSAALLLMFALAMSISFGIKSAINYSVFAASAAALLLAIIQRKSARSD